MIKTKIVIKSDKTNINTSILISCFTTSIIFIQEMYVFSSTRVN